MWKNRIRYGGFVLVSVFLLLFYHHYFFFLLLLGLLLLPVFSFLTARYTAKNVSLQLRIPTMTIEEGNYVRIVFAVENKTYLPMPQIQIRFGVENRFYPNEEIQEMTFPLRTGKKEYQWSICPIYAGSIRLHPERVWMRDYLGFWEFPLQVPAEKEIFSTPKKSMTVIQLLELYNEEGEEIPMDALNSVEDVTQIKELRAYRPGDRLQRVHWKLSTKQEDLLVKEFERELNRTVTLLLELKTDDKQVGNLDQRMRAFYSTALYLLDQEERFQIQWYDAEKEQFKTFAVDSAERLETCLQQLYRMQTYPEAMAYLNYKQSTKKQDDMAIYFAEKHFTDYRPEQLLGVFEDRVLIVCL